MPKKVLSILLALLCSLAGGAAFAQVGSGAIRGKITDEKNEPVIGANVRLYVNDAFKDGSVTDEEGKYSISGLDPANYTVKISFAAQEEIRQVQVIAEGTATLNVKFEEKTTGVVIINQTRTKLFEPGQHIKSTMNREQIQAVVSRDVNSIVATGTGVFQVDEGRAISLRGQRSGGTVYFIDGVKVTGSLGLPKDAIEQTTTLNSGLPAAYGDASGGVVSVTTRGPAGRMSYGAEYLTSELLDGYHFNLAAVNASGPILKRKAETDSNGKVIGERRTLLGFYAGFEGEFNPEPSPSAIPVYTLSKAKLTELQETPLRPSPLGQGFVKTAEFVTKDDFVKNKTFSFDQTNSYRFSGRLDFQPSPIIRVTAGGRFSLGDAYGFDLRNQLYNPDNNGRSVSTTGVAWARFTQRLGVDKKGNRTDNGSALKNAYYSVQADYSRFLQRQEDPTFGDDFFSYGHVGQFDLRKARVYSYETRDINGNPVTGFHQVGFRDTAVYFNEGAANPLLANYVDAVFNAYGNDPNSRPQTIFDVQALSSGVINGSSPQSVFSLYFNSGFPFNGYSKTDNTQVRLVTQGFAEIGDHKLQLGFEFEQRTNTAWNIAPFGLWRQMRLLANSHLTELDEENPIFQGFDTINYQRLYNAETQTNFDKNIREKLGLAVDNATFINIDSLPPSFYTLDMFNVGELDNSDPGRSFVDYFGFDYLGNKLKNRPGAFDFFRDTVNRPIGAFAPIYVAGYIEDHFRIEDFDLRLGVRIDRYDANQPVLKDPYTLFAARTASEVNFSDYDQSGTTGSAQRPGNIPDDAVIYIEDNKAARPKIVGYRQGDSWFTSNGTETNGLEIRNLSPSGIQPLLVDRAQEKVSENAFKDYEAQVNVMPRLALTFPVNEQAQFFAHYDILTQRPTTGTRFDPRQYFYNQREVGSILNNPDLRPERTIDYELGFQQEINKSTGLTLSAFYREMRDMIQAVPVNYAYPRNYNTLGNIDFGTVKGFIAVLEVQQTGNFRINANYTLQFADGTGSSATSSAGTLNSGQDLLRIFAPLSFDQRHRFVTNFDYGFAGGEAYEGPGKGGRLQKILENLSANAVVNLGSGTPFSRQSNITQAAAFGIADRSVNRGGINGSRLPWNFRVNARLDKDLMFTLREDETEGGVAGGKILRRGRQMQLNISLQVLNLFNTQNILGVYRATGNPDDDGFLTSALGAQQLRTFEALGQAQAFTDQYNLRVDNPFNYSQPRIIRLGLRASF